MVDGDAIEVTPEVHGRVDVRLIGVDTPETYSEAQPYGSEASSFASSRLERRKVGLEFDAERTDPYDRLLAYVHLPNGSMFNETLVKKGYAQVATFPPNVKYVVRFKLAQREARNAGLGLWGLSQDQLCQQTDRGNGTGGGCASSPQPALGSDPSLASGGIPPLPFRGDYDDFTTQGQAQKVLEWDPSDPYYLNVEDDGLLYEGLL